MKRAMMIAIAFLLVAGLAFSAAQGQTGRSGETIVEKVCANCHSRIRICYNLGKGEDFWFSTVARMMSHGAPIVRSEVDGVAAYLSELAPGAPEVCR